MLTLAEDAADLRRTGARRICCRCCSTPSGDTGRVRRSRATPQADIDPAQGYGDVEAVFSSAAHIVVDWTLPVGRHSGVPLETRGAIARYDVARDMSGAARRREGAARGTAT